MDYDKAPNLKLGKFLACKWKSVTVNLYAQVLVNDFEF